VDRKNFISKLDEIESNLWGYVLFVPKEISDEFTKTVDRRIVCHIQGLQPFKCGLIPNNGGYMILINKKRRQELLKQNPLQIEVTIEKDNSEFGMDASSEFLETLSQFPLAEAYFNELTSGRKRALIYWADNVKNSDIKIRRAIVLCKHLIEQNGMPDFKLMNTAIKEANALYKKTFNQRTPRF